MKLILEEGDRSYIVPFVKIARPLISNPKDESKDNEYKISLILHLGNDKTHDLDEYIKIIKS